MAKTTNDYEECDYECDTCGKGFVAPCMDEATHAHRKIVCTDDANKLLEQMKWEEFNERYVSP